MGRFLFKLAVISILCLLAYLLFRYVVKIVKEDFPQKVEWLHTTRTDYSAEISDLTIEHNQSWNDKNGMYVYSTQTWRNLKGETCYSVLRFFDDQGKPLEGKQIRDEFGEFCITGEIVPENKKCINDQRVFVAYSEFDLPVAGTVYFLCDIRLYIYDKDGEIVELAYSNPCRFHITR